MPERDQRTRTRRPLDDRPTATADPRPTETTVGCDLCDQTVPATEAVPVTVGDAGEQTLCAFCASSLFEDVDLDAACTGRGSERPATDDHRAAAVSWAPPPMELGTGLPGALVKTHVLSLSLLWAIHRTNVRMAERLIDEVDVELLAVLGTVLTTVGLLVSALV